MNDFSILYNLGLTIVAAAILVLGVRAARIPTIVSYLVTGLVLGPLTGLVQVSETTEIISEAGIILLLFLVGLELSPDKIKDVGKTAFLAGGLQMALTAGGGFGIALLFGFPAVHALFLGVALMFSSTVIVIKLLDRQGDIQAQYGRISVGVLLVQDLVVVIVLTFVAGFEGTGEMEIGTIALNLGLAFLGMALLVGVAMAASRYLLPPVFGWVSSSPEVMFIWSLCWCFLFVLGAEALRLSPEIGAFLAGISLAQLPYNHTLRRRVHPLMNFFIVIFFVSLGVQTDLAGATAHWQAAVALAAFVIAVKPLLFMGLLPKLGYGEQTAFLTGVTLAQISEFSFIFAALSLASDLIDATLLSLVTAVGLITFAVSAFLILYNRRLYDKARGRGLLKPFGAKQDEREETKEALRGHVIVVGVNPMSRYVIEALIRHGETVLVIDTDRRKLEGLPCHTLQGNAMYTSVLKEADLASAKLLISAVQIEDVNNLLAYRCRRLGIPCSIHAFDRSVVADLRELGVDYLIRSKNEGTKQIVQILRERGVLLP